MLLEDIRFYIAFTAVSMIIFALIYMFFMEKSTEEKLVKKRMISHRAAFEHRYFKLLLFNDPSLLFKRLLDDKESAVVSIWNDIGVTEPDELSEITKLYSSELVLFIHKESNDHVVIIKMPKPVVDNDCYYLALFFPQKMTIDNVRYLMLLKDENSTVLAEWSHRGEYIEHIKGITPRIDYFYRALLGILEQKKTPEDLDPYKGKT